ncbi:FAD-dependent monooxygenase [Actinoplanes friuliensis]|uniref:3-(3-hydroxy-phenyl)propionate/3-hydroxycinnamic acid hydroxylase n=1 Tax=Actinoplanes friuliensis DSM 7358 TaxID=1246995 RepID=U5W913_9ACTN|nr:FAD-dependent monooxygenase [Actinoplanes friuliensis]AGZ44485.1 3-(3-hydroxy-phenyl)propionate/3- hydroxycinnamic acid hydroxylase [Actinoplanes friuliensis DSM 7358]
MTQREVLISGAGMAGPALAHQLHRHGFVPTVVERAPVLRDGGYKVDIRGAAIEVLKRMGVFEAARAVDTGMRHVTYVKRDGGRIARLDADLLMGRRNDDLEVMRTDLTRILYDATAADVEYVFGDAIASMTEGPDGVDVIFESGAARRFALVVGADGVHSATRRKVMGEVPLRYLGGHISIFDVPNGLGLDREEVFYTEPGRMVFAYSTGPSAPAKVGLVCGSPSPVLDRESFAEQFTGLGWRVPDFLAAMRASENVYLDSLSQIELPRWSAGRVVLLGDAAHCPSPAAGQGTSMALVGAYALAGELAAAGGDHRTAFDRYETLLRPFVEKNLAFGRKMAGDMVPGGRFALAFRNYGMRTLKYHPLKRQIVEKVTQPLHVAANAIELPSYPMAPAV